MIRLFNTLTRKKEKFSPLKKKVVGLYTCGPTVYDYAHIGNLRTYIFEDILRRTLEYNGYQVKQAMNITDVGHLTSDADTGQDKMEKGARREKKTVWEIAKYYTQAFKKDLKALNIKEPTDWLKATDYIKDQIELVKKLEQKGFTYQIDDGVYFDSSKFKDYGKLARLDIKGLKQGARIKAVKGKKNPTDFALWKFSVSGKKRAMEWDSPWGVGFPGWHLECSVLSTLVLNQPFDIHTGGVDHLNIHHTNEIAQSEAAFNKPLAKYWLHGEFLLLKEGRMGKSEGNLIRLSDLTEKGFNPLAFRYLVVGAHYRSKLNFTIKSLVAAQNSLERLINIVSEMGPAKIGCAEFEQDFQEAINNDLDTPRALSILWNLLKSDYPDHAKKQTLLKFDQVLGLGLAEIKKTKVKIPKSVKDLLDKREKARKENDFTKADDLRKEIEKAGFEIQDTDQGPKLKQI